ncbi:hypothetical protein [Kibdelosporangium philippinense]|uniref:hypothetical protein n=1 Tax=Kibdelosporangium philippinense TaxID=211113 RepID=UPI00361889CB
MCAITPSKDLFSHANADDAGSVTRADGKASHQNLFSQQQPESTGTEVARPKSLPRNPFQLPS